MNRFSQALCAAAVLVVAATAQAQLSSTITATSDYDFRGFSQTATDPALQASLDYAFPSGFAVGAWASNVDFGNDVDADVEVDYYASFSRAINEDTSWTLGATLYSYPSSDDVNDYPEFYVGLDSGRFSFKQWYADDLYDLDVGSAYYTEGEATFELRHGIALLVHAGYSWGDYWDDEDEGGGGALIDYSIGLGYSAGNFDLELSYVGTDASGAQKITTDENNNEGRVIFTIATTLPWGAEE